MKIIKRTAFRYRLKTRSVAGVIVFSVLMAGLYANVDHKHPMIDAGPIIQNVGTNGVTIRWWSRDHEAATVWLYDAEGQTRVMMADQIGPAFTARLDNLQASTEYDYRVELTSTNHASVSLYGTFHTAPKAGETITFNVFGDSDDKRDSHYRLARVMSQHPADIVLHTGDLMYRHVGAADYPAQFFHQYDKVIGSMAFYPVLGNHDVEEDGGASFLNTFSLPDNGPAGVPAGHCYWFDYGDARFAAIDSNLDARSLSNAVAPWLKMVMESSSKSWRIVFFHHPPLAGGGRNIDDKICQSLVPGMEQSGVDIVFNGHNHLYERTYSMLDGKPVHSNGVVYITSGAGGKSLHREKSAGAPYLAAFDSGEYSYTRVSLNSQSLELSQISEHNRILDSLKLTARR